ncbi:MAG: hypothetical protein IJY97_10280 [Clostridia bacterium]|nr:hypothetical protein [Clostridia bacterium]
MKRLFLIILATLMLFSCSCQKTPGGEDISSESETVKQPEPQYMAYHFSQAARVGDDVYFMVLASAQDTEQIRASEYGSENFDTFVPCFDTLCIKHSNRAQCCVATTAIGGSLRDITAFQYGDEPALVLFNPVDTCLSKPYSNIRVNLMCEDYLNSDNVWEEFKRIDKERKDAGTRIKRSDPLVYKDYFYYVQLQSGIRTQYRVSLEGGEPERVFEEDNIIIKTIINDRFYGVRYDDDIGEQPGIVADRDKMHYFRSDMNYSKVEPLPEILDYFYLPIGDNFDLRSNVILDADSESIYVLSEKKVWALPDSDIYAEPVLLLDLEEKISFDLQRTENYEGWYGGGAIYAFLGTGTHQRALLDENGFNKSVQWDKNVTFYSFDIKSGECKSRDISNETYLITEIQYADSKYVYARGKYLHDDGRAVQGVTIRLTLETLKYETLLSPYFLNYSAE